MDIIQLHDQSSKKIEKPNSFEEMLRLSRVLSAGIPYVRVDLYEVDQKPYFGEFTFYHQGRAIPFKTEKWDEIFGSWIKLPEKDKIN